MIETEKLKQSNNILSPVLYLPHGGGPLPLLGDKSQEDLVTFLKEIPKTVTQPSAILIISAHWEERQATITSGDQQNMIYDYSGFPPEAYEIQYPAPGNSELAKEIGNLIRRDGIGVKLDEERGFDHGMYVPLKIMYPEAQIPCLQLSLLKSFVPSEHIALGKSLASLRNKNVLIIGSGFSFHNLKLFFRPEKETHEKSIAFDKWLVDTCSNSNLSVSLIEQQLNAWKKAPYARHCHPREEHLLPLHVCFGAACLETPIAKVIYNGDFMGARTTGLRWG
jgi:aromatic ring-opening dioxygenase catalytic subunit (LigB family)